MSEFLTKQQIEEFHQCFDLFDKDGSGKIGTKELGTILRCFGQNPTEAEIQDLANEELDFEEFLSLMCKKMADTDTDVEMKNAFNVIDLDGNSKISAGELKKLFENGGDRVTDEEVEEMIREADLDGDGFVDLEEFKRVMMGR